MKNKFKLYNNFVKYYKQISLVILFGFIYILIYPILDHYITTIFNIKFECSFKALTGRPCPLCGGTTYFKNMFRVIDDITYIFHPFGIILIFSIYQIIFRIYIIIVKFKVNKIILLIDYISIILFILFVIFYEISYLII